LTGEIVNLRKARKAKVRSQKDAQAAENRIRYGTPKTERSLLEAEERLSARRLDGHKLTQGRPDRPSPDDPSDKQR
jgi:hypothetical protein